ncbi:pyridoxal phosphate-dependent decarboxylase family protein [Sinomicrobium weinanense]|uniref:Aspartate aminotransferase family protein n=1 Tax=Sinomicrobium weinanense TaxID=2842200 RepID=A0A926Q258_9FLAO|nr:pyridoxal-dependent decarboxylase [Sinomicrobium weinanense]MBC9796312.1 aspartate aminotransferase family protein [Sinomicrobium weinanense]MBU3123207.1 aspartate aminotransferase family protein [Sinomicrobium weinanense]
MYHHLQKELNELDTLLDKVRKQGVHYLKNLRQRPASTTHQVGDAPGLNEEGLGAEGTLELFNQRLEPLMVSSSGPRYLGFVIGGSTPASIAGDWLASIYDQNTQTVEGQGDISAVIELETIKLLLDLFELPPDFFGGFVTGATMSNFTCLAVARQWYGRELGKDYAKDGIRDDVHILTTTPHSSSVKSLAMLGLGSRNITKVNTLKGNREAMDIDELENKIEELQGSPFILISSAGTVNTVDFDDFKAIAKLRQKHRFWWHIDAAFGGFAICSPAYKHLMDGWEQADSITVDCHKWLNVPYESAFFLVREEHKLLQAETFQNSNAPYLGDPMENFNYLNFLPENSRRLKALPVWFSLTAYGKKGYRDIVENAIEMTQLFGNFIEQNPYFELLAPVRLNTVCFTLAGAENQDKVNAFLTALNDTGKVFMTPTVYNSKKGVRAAFVNWMTDTRDIDIITKEMNLVIKKV